MDLRDAPDGRLHACVESPSGRAEVPCDYIIDCTGLDGDITSHFKPALVGRMKVVPYYPLRRDVMRKIIHLKLGKIRRRLEEQREATLDVSDAAIEAILARCTEADTGARNVDHILTGTVMPELSRRILSGLVEGKVFSRVTVGVGGDGNFVYDVKG